MLVLPEARVADVADRALLIVKLFNVSVEDASFKVVDLLARVYFAEVSEVVETDEFAGCFPHGVNVEPAFSPASGG